MISRSSAQIGIEIGIETLSALSSTADRVHLLQKDIGIEMTLLLLCIGYCY